MRYIDAYEIIQASLVGKAVGFPITEKLLSTYFDQAVQDVGQRVVKDVGIYSYNDNKALTISADTTDVAPYALGYKHSRGFLLNTGINFLSEDNAYAVQYASSANMEMYGRSIFKVERDGKAIPFLGHDRVLTTNTDTSTEDYQIGWWIWHDQRSYNIQNIASQNPFSPNMYPAPSDVEKGERLRFSGLEGGDDTVRESLNRDIIWAFNQSSYSVSVEINASATNFTAQKGVMRTDNWWVMFNQVPIVSDDIKLWFYKKPAMKKGNNEDIDLPEPLPQACIYHAIGHIMVIGGGDMQIASGYRGLGRSMEREFTDTHGAREPMPDIVPNPLTDFNYTS